LLIFSLLLHSWKIPGSYEDEDANRGRAADQLAVYLWENYIEPNEATEIFFLGVGDAFRGLVNLLINHERVHTRVKSVISFVAENPVRAVSSHTTTWLSKWYKDNSLIFVSHLHSVWAPGDNSKKPSKRYGRLIRSPKKGLTEMLQAHKDQVTDFMLERIADEEGDGERDEEG